MSGTALCPCIYTLNIVRSNLTILSIVFPRHMLESERFLSFSLASPLSASLFPCFYTCKIENKSTMPGVGQEGPKMRQGTLQEAKERVLKGKKRYIYSF